MKFNEVFYKAKLDKDSRDRFYNLEVDSIKSNTEADTIRVHITSPYLIPYLYVVRTSNAIREAYFAEGVDVGIDLKYKLSGLYTPKTLWETYRDSIISELSSEASLNGSLLQHAKVDWISEDEMQITLENSVIARRRERSIEGFLHRIYLDRCDLPVKITFAYADVEESAFHKEREHRVRKRVEEIADRVFRGDRDVEEDDGTLAIAGAKTSVFDMDSEGPTGVAAKAGNASGKADTGNTSAKADDKNKLVGASKKDKKDGKGDKKFDRRDSVRRPLNRSENPDVLYGRDASGDITPISEITDEIGMVTIRGKIYKMEDRALRNEKHLFSFAVTDDTDSIMCKVFTFEDQKDEFSKAVHEGDYVRIKGVAKYDTFSHEITISSIDGIAKSVSDKKKRSDLSLCTATRNSATWTAFPMRRTSSNARIPGACRRLPSPITAWYRPFRTRSIHWIKSIKTGKNLSKSSTAWKVILWMT